MCIFTPWGILPRNHHRRKSNTTTTPTTSTSSPAYTPRLVHIQPQKHYQSLNYPAPKSKPLSINTRHHHLSSETQPLLSNSHSRSPPLRTRTSPTSPTYPSHQLRIRHLTAQLLQRQTLETRRDVLASLADRYHDVPQPSSSSSPPRRRRRATISPPLSSVVSSSSISSQSSTEGWGSPVRGRGRRGSVSTPATSVSLGSSGMQGGVGIGGHGIGNGNGNGNGNGAGVNGYGYTLPFVQAPQLPLFGAASSSSVVSGSAEGSDTSTVSEYWTNGRGVGGGFGEGWGYWNDSAPVESRRAGGGVVNSWGEGRRRGDWDRGAGVGYATMGGLREARERTERGLGRLEGEIGRARAGVGDGGYRLWTWE